MRRRLLTVQGPLQYITGYIAQSWQQTSSPCEDTLLLYDFLCAPEVEDQIADAVLSIAGSVKWKRIVHIRGDQMTVLMRQRYRSSILGLKNMLGESDFDDIYLARNHVGDGSALLLNAYAAARKHAYGDSFGLVGQQEALARLEGPAGLKTRLRELTRSLIFGAPKPVPFDDAVLSLPIDMSGTYLQRTPFLVPSHAHVSQTLKSMYDVMLELRGYCDKLRTRSRMQETPLYLLSNLAGSGLCSIEQEVELYLDVIREYSLRGQTLFIKPHPRSSFEFLKAIQRQLLKDYDVVIVDDPRFARLPIELWVGLMAHCNLIAMFSTSCINLKYIYSKKVVLPLNDARMSRYFQTAPKEHVVLHYRLMKEAMQNLDDWDGNSALWSA